MSVAPVISKIIPGRRTSGSKAESRKQRVDETRGKRSVRRQSIDKKVTARKSLGEMNR